MDSLKAYGAGYDSRNYSRRLQDYPWPLVVDDHFLDERRRLGDGKSTFYAVRIQRNRTDIFAKANELKSTTSNVPVFDTSFLVS